jgi:hypothetical protein
MALVKRFAWKAGTAGLALSFLSAHAMAAVCARPQDIAALKTAALQQQLMVAAFMCNDAAAYNRFVVTNQSELQDADKAVMDFFLRRDEKTGSAAYNAYKTKLANSSSLTSQRNARFCASTASVFDALLNRKMKLVDLVSTRVPGFEAAYTPCTNAKPEVTLAAAISTPARAVAIAAPRPQAAPVRPIAKVAPVIVPKAKPALPHQVVKAEPAVHLANAVPARSLMANAPSIPARRAALPDIVPAKNLPPKPESAPAPRYESEPEEVYEQEETIRDGRSEIAGGNARRRYGETRPLEERAYEPEGRDDFRQENFRERAARYEDRPRPYEDRYAYAEDEYADPRERFYERSYGRRSYYANDVYDQYEDDPYYARGWR